MFGPYAQRFNIAIWRRFFATVITNVDTMLKHATAIPIPTPDKRPSRQLNISVKMCGARPVIQIHQLGQLITDFRGDCRCGEDIAQCESNGSDPSAWLIRASPSSDT